MRSHHAMKVSRAEARRELRALRTTRVDDRHSDVSDNLIETHLSWHDDDDEV